jgi:hypothetical protein
MKTSILAIPALLASAAYGWELTFYGIGGQHVATHGTKDVKCQNLISSFTQKTHEIHWYPVTNLYPDPKSFTAYTGTDCKGSSFTGAGANIQFPNPPRVFKSYKLS